MSAMTSTTSTTSTKQPVKSLVDLVMATRADIVRLRVRANAVLDQELEGIAAKSGTDQTLRLKRRDALEQIVEAAAWLAGDLIIALESIASGEDPNPVMASDLPKRIRDAEVRLEILREISGRMK